jgi:3D (Asp-Asp-Asp) domain-containing protein
MSKYKKIAEIADLSISLVLLASFIVYFMFPHVVLAKEIKKSKNLEFDISKAFKAVQVSAISKTGVADTAGSVKKINYKPSAVISDSEEVIKKSVNLSARSEDMQKNNIMAYVHPDGDYKVIGKRQVYITAYSSTPDQTDSTPFITASNKHVRDGIVAANFLPFGAKIKIPSVFGDKIFVVEDRMNARYARRVDIWFPTRQEALNFGIKTLDIEILEAN